MHAADETFATAGLHECGCTYGSNALLAQGSINPINMCAHLQDAFSLSYASALLWHGGFQGLQMHSAAQMHECSK